MNANTLLACICFLAAPFTTLASGIDIGGGGGGSIPIGSVETVKYHGPLSYTVAYSKIKITDCDTDVTGVFEVPAEIEGIPVVSIGQYAFKSCTSLTNIILPESITRIERFAFQGCSSLTDITIPNSVESIGEAAFGYCTSLRTVTLPSNNKFKYINVRLFNGCNQLRSIEIPGAVASIGHEAFKSCSNLASVTFLDYEYLNGNNELVIETSQLGYIGSFAFYRTGLISIDIPDSVTTIRESAFYGCKDLVAINLPHDLTTIEASAFENCSALASVTLPDRLTTLSHFLFKNCTALTTINLPEGITRIPQGAFENCSSLETISLPNGITEIRTNAFRGCTALTNITLPTSLTRIFNFAFYGCHSLTSIHIPASVIHLSYPFPQCKQLSEITVAPGNTHFESIDGVLYNEVLTSLLQFPANHSANHFDIPSSVTEIKGHAFEGSVNLTSVTLPESLRRIAECAFADCYNLADIEFSENLNSIEHRAFDGCHAITTVAIPTSVTYIDVNAFSNCRNLTSFTLAPPANPNYSVHDGILYNYDKTRIRLYPFGRTDTSFALPDTMEHLSTSVFDSNPNLTSIHLTAHSRLYSYDGLRQSQNLKAIIVDSEHTRLKSVDGVLYSADMNEIICYPAGKTDTYFTIPDGVTRAETNAFSGNTHLASIVFPAGFDYGEHSIFVGCNNLVAITFEGHAPEYTGENKILKDSPETLTVYFHEGATGFTTPMWQDRKSVMIGTGQSVMNHWTATHLNGTGYTAEDLHPSADPDRDLGTNREEYAFGGEPGTMDFFQASTVSRGTPGSNTLTLTFNLRASATDLTYILQTTDSLMNETPWVDRLSYTPQGSGFVPARHTDMGTELLSMQDLGNGFFEITEQLPAGIQYARIKLVDANAP